VTWVAVLALAAEAVLIVTGIAVVPDTIRSITGVATIAADLGLLVVIGVAAWRGPVALTRLTGSSVVCLYGAAAFAVAYLLSLLLDLLQRPVPPSPYAFFVVVAFAVSACAATRTGSLTTGILTAVWSLVLGTVLWSVGWLAMIYAFWGTSDARRFWVSDGAISDYHRSGTSNLSVFLIRDIQGAMFFHPVLSVVLGVTCGLVGAGLARATARMRGSVPRPL
jgi:hypothetical protein